MECLKVGICGLFSFCFFNYCLIFFESWFGKFLLFGLGFFFVCVLDIFSIICFVIGVCCG